VNNDGLLDLFVVNYMQWKYSDQPLCAFHSVADYCHPRYYKPTHDQLFINNGDGTFRDASATWGLRDHPGKGIVRAWRTTISTDARTSSKSSRPPNQQI